MEEKQCFVSGGYTEGRRKATPGTTNILYHEFYKMSRTFLEEVSYDANGASFFDR